MRGNITSLFIATLKAYKPVSNDTVVRWIKSTLTAAIIDVKLYCHTNRSAFTSKSILQVEIGPVLKAGGSAACMHLQNIHKKLICSEHEFANAILHSTN